MAAKKPVNTQKKKDVLLKKIYDLIVKSDDDVSLGEDIQELQGELEAVIPIKKKTLTVDLTPSEASELLQRLDGSCVPDPLQERIIPLLEKITK